MNSSSCNKIACSAISKAIPSKASPSSSSIAISESSMESLIASSNSMNLLSSFSRLTFSLLSPCAFWGSSQTEGSLS